LHETLKPAYINFLVLIQIKITFLNFVSNQIKKKELKRGNNIVVYSESLSGKIIARNLFLKNKKKKLGRRRVGNWQR